MTARHPQRGARRFHKGTLVQITSPAARSTRRGSWRLAACVAANLAVATAAAGQSATGPDAATPERTVVQDDDPAVLNPAEPDVVVVNLPTAMRQPVLKGSFRLTHRFAGNLRRGTFGQQLSNLFGLDQGATIGFEYRVGVARHVQAAFYRSSFDKTIQLHGKYDATRQQGSMPVSISPVVSIEGTNNFQEEYAPAVGVVISRIVGTRVAAYITPMWVGNTAASLAVVEHAHDDVGNSGDIEPPHQHRSTTYVGLGGRLRMGGASYVAAEIVLRARGYAPDEPAYGVSIERRVGGHTFSLTFTNTSGTTFAQLARGGAVNSLYLGFNLGRKFF